MKLVMPFTRARISRRRVRTIRGQAGLGNDYVISDALGETSGYGE